MDRHSDHRAAEYLGDVRETVRSNARTLVPLLGEAAVEAMLAKREEAERLLKAGHLEAAVDAGWDALLMLVPLDEGCLCGKYQDYCLCTKEDGCACTKAPELKPPADARAYLALRPRLGGN